jgi:hypothetical protein
VHIHTHTHIYTSSIFKRENSGSFKRGCLTRNLVLFFSRIFYNIRLACGFLLLLHCVLGVLASSMKGRRSLGGVWSSAFNQKNTSFIWFIGSVGIVPRILF